MSSNLANREVWKRLKLRQVNWAVQGKTLAILSTRHLILGNRRKNRVRDFIESIISFYKQLDDFIDCTVAQVSLVLSEWE